MTEFSVLGELSLNIDGVWLVQHSFQGLSVYIKAKPFMLVRLHFIPYGTSNYVDVLNEQSIQSHREVHEMSKRTVSDSF